MDVILKDRICCCCWLFWQNLFSACGNIECVCGDCSGGASYFVLQLRHNRHNGVPNHKPHDCLLNRLSRRRSRETSKLRGTCLCPKSSPVTGELPEQMASNAENVSIWWRLHDDALKNSGSPVRIGFHESMYLIITFPNGPCIAIFIKELDASPTR